MPKVSPIQSSFGSGEFSPVLNGQVTNPRYREALETCLNYIPTVQATITRRPGTNYVAEVKTSAKATRVVAFEFSVTQAYILEFGDQYVRFYRNNGQILDTGSPYEVSTPFLEADLFNLKFTQSADVLYISHPSYAPRSLSRTGHTSWTLATVPFTDGPYLPINSTTTSLTPSAATGDGITLSSGATTAITGAADNGAGLIRITSTAHGKVTGDDVGISGVVGTTEANASWTITRIDDDNFDLDGSTFSNAYTSDGDVYPAIFVSTDVGRMIRLKEGSVWGWGTIATFVNYGQVTFDVEDTLTNTNAKTFWRLGSWSDTTGYPATTTFHEDRLGFAGASGTPQRIDLSATGDYFNFQPSGLDGVVTDTDALSFTFNANDVNVVRWLLSDSKGLIAGSVGGEWLISPSSSGEALTPSNVTAKRSTFHGSANIQATQMGNATLFIQKAGRKIRELSYFIESDGFVATDLTILAEHITQSGVVEMASQLEPQPILWAVRTDGVLAGLTYERESGSLKVGWHRHILGGPSDAAGSDAIVESVASIPSPDGTRDELWVVVKRYVHGADVRYIEYIGKIFDDTVEQKDAFFVDSGLTYDAPLAITNITQASPAVVTSTAHGLSNGDKVLVSGVKGMSEVNTESYLVANVAANTFELTDLVGTDIDSSAFTAYVSGGEVREFVNTLAGLDHLEGESVAILADGAVQPNKTVASGEITLSTSATTVHVGYGYNSDGKMLRLNAGAADGTSIGKTQRSHRIGIMLHRSLGLKIGMSFSDLTELVFRTTSDALNRAVPLFTGIRSETIEADYDFENQFCFRQSQPLPSTILAIMPQMHTQDR